MNNQHPRAWRAAWILTFVMVLGTMDRTLPGVLGDPIRQSLAISDTQLSLLVGMAFATCYAVCALPMGWLADRYSRPRVIAVGVVIWCVATAASGFATSFEKMFLFRMGVGLGEAALVPSAISLMADLFPRSAMPRAMGLFNAGGLFGIALAYPAGPALTQLLDGQSLFGMSSLPDEGWRLTFIVIGAVGLFVTLWVLSLPEPRRGAAGQAKASNRKQEPLLPYLKRSASFTIPLLSSLILLNLYANGYLMWLTPYFTRSFGWDATKIGQLLGISVLVGGIAGSLLGGWMTTVFTRKLGRDAAMQISAIIIALLAPLAIVTPLSPSGEMAMILTALQLTLAFAASAVLPTVLVNTSPSHLRARFFATNLFLGQLIGAGFGPTIFGLITDHAFHDPTKLYLSLSVGAGAIFAPLLVLLWRTAGQYQKALDGVEQPA